MLRIVCLRRSQNFTSSVAIRMPPSVPLKHSSCSENHKINRGPIPLFQHHCSGVTPALSTLNFFKVKFPFTETTVKITGKPAGFFQNGSFPPFCGTARLN
ncbi:hypothetical protein JTE90_003511 [Oedothorax gibbosus]|uniref:Uncharacterized protein n=1 Tax=Oedothorax gibbosus TaxID=931172 RepID=A0AAV6TH46_9ARAC|nr:hypothetical protein JTE90_003511 [Oedothorax gibbosus]